MESIKIGDVVRVKRWGHDAIMRQVKEIDPRGFIRADDGEVYALCNVKDDEGFFFF